MGRELPRTKLWETGETKVHFAGAAGQPIRAKRSPSKASASSNWILRVSRETRASKIQIDCTSSFAILPNIKSVANEERLWIFRICTCHKLKSFQSGLTVSSQNCKTLSHPASSLLRRFSQGRWCSSAPALFTPSSVSTVSFAPSRCKIWTLMA